VTVRAKLSAGLLMYRRQLGVLEVLLAHPGGPYFRRRDAGFWTIPKGLVEPGEEPRQAAIREFSEEMGLQINEPLLELGQVIQKGGKQVCAWAFCGDAPPGFQPASNTFEIEWPPRSGRRQTFPEVDRAEFFELVNARHKINPAQQAFIERLVTLLNDES
jgi:predicted NUDIX family NTP pyrophosphohydrolase